MKHGTRSAYNHLKCRCAACVEANREYHRGLVKRLSRLDPPKHGFSGYVNYRCRCDVCTDANKRHCVDWRQRREPVSA